MVDDGLHKYQWRELIMNGELLTQMKIAILSVPLLIESET